MVGFLSRMKLCRVEFGCLSVILMVRPKSCFLLSAGLEGPFSPGFGLPGAPGLLLLGLPIVPAGGCFAKGGTIRFLTSAVPAMLLVAVDFEGFLVLEAADFLEAPTEGLLLITVATRWVLFGLTVFAELVIDDLAVEDADGLFVTIGPAMRVVLFELMRLLELVVGGFTAEEVDRLFTMTGPPIRLVPVTPVRLLEEAAGGLDAGEDDRVELELLGGLLVAVGVRGCEGVVLLGDRLGVVLLGERLGVVLLGERLGVVRLGARVLDLDVLLLELRDEVRGVLDRDGVLATAAGAGAFAICLDGVVLGAGLAIGFGDGDVVICLDGEGFAAGLGAGALGAGLAAGLGAGALGAGLAAGLGAGALGAALTAGLGGGALGAGAFLAGGLFCPEADFLSLLLALSARSGSAHIIKAKVSVTNTILRPRRNFRINMICLLSKLF